jgi:hypothetical protein
MSLLFISLGRAMIHHLSKSRREVIGREGSDGQTGRELLHGLGSNIQTWRPLSSPAKGGRANRQ